MIDSAMLRRLMTHCGMERMVIDDNAIKLARAIYAQGAADEREACAKVCDESAWGVGGPAERCAKAIRARSNAKVRG